MNSIPHPMHGGVDLAGVGQQPPSFRVVNVCGVGIVSETYERTDAICSLRFIDIPGNQVHMITLPLKTAQVLLSQLQRAVNDYKLIETTEDKHVN